MATTVSPPPTAVRLPSSAGDMIASVPSSAADEKSVSFLRRIFPSSSSSAAKQISAPPMTAPTNRSKGKYTVEAQQGAASPAGVGGATPMIASSMRRTTSGRFTNPAATSSVDGQRTLYSTQRTYLSPELPQTLAAQDELSSPACRDLRAEFEDACVAASAAPVPNSVALPATAIVSPKTNRSLVMEIFSPVFSLFQAAGYFRHQQQQVQPQLPLAAGTQPPSAPAMLGGISQPTAPITSAAALQQLDSAISEAASAAELAAQQAQLCQAQSIAEQCIADMELEEQAAEEESADMECDEEANSPYAFIRRLPFLPRGAKPGKAILGPRGAGLPRATLVLDLDETLVHCSTEPMASADLVFPVVWGGTEYHVFAKKRPFLEEFLDAVSQMFELVVFTASQQVYADKLLDILDPSRRWFRHRVFREGCVCVEGNYLKDLSVLGRDLATTVIVDNSPQAFGYQYNNGIPILSWFDAPDDLELQSLLPFLARLAVAPDVRPIIRAQYKLYRRIETRH